MCIRDRISDFEFSEWAELELSLNLSNSTNCWSYPFLFFYDTMMCVFVWLIVLICSRKLGSIQSLITYCASTYAWFIVSLPFVQVIAFFLGPDKDSKIQRYWNWYHHWVGRLALFLAVVNIFLGIKVGGAGTSLKVGYGINLGVLLLATVILEVILWTRWSQKTVAPPTY